MLSREKIRIDGKGKREELRDGWSKRGGLGQGASPNCSQEKLEQDSWLYLLIELN